MPSSFSGSSYLSENGYLLNVTWNDTSPRAVPHSGAIWEWDDATWILAASFIIFTMQTGEYSKPVGLLTRTRFRFLRL